MWWVIAAVALLLLVIAAPVIALIALVVAITGIVALVKDKPTWLRFRSRTTATLATIIAAVVFFGAGTVTGVLYPAAAERGGQVAAPTSTPAAFMSTPSATPTREAEPEPEETIEPVDAVESPEPFTGQARTVRDQSATAGLTAPAVLATLEVKGRAPQTGYDRDAFGQRWLDVDRNGCDTRNDILARDLTETAIRNCRVYAGSLTDPFTGQVIEFERGERTSTLVQIDHVVALSDAWQKGAQLLSPDQRATLANDPINLLAVSEEGNSAKGAGDAATWLPENTSFRCAYVARQVSVKATYGLWVTQAEHDAIERVLQGCPDQAAFTSTFAPAPPAPSPTAKPAPAPTKKADPAPPKKVAPAKPKKEKKQKQVSYKNCSAVRADGAAPIHRGEPGYGRHLDRDGDGVGCE